MLCFMYGRIFENMKKKTCAAISVTSDSMDTYRNHFTNNMYNKCTKYQFDKSHVNFTENEYSSGKINLLQKLINKIKKSL